MRIAWPVMTTRRHSMPSPNGDGDDIVRCTVRAARRAALIVGHSNTVPETVQALTGTAVSPIAETELERLYRITATANGTVESTF